MMIASLIRWGSWALFQELLADCVPDCVSDCILIASLIRWGSWALFQELLGELKLVADRHGTTIANVAVCWVLRQLGPQGGWVVLGVRDTTHLVSRDELR